VEKKKGLLSRLRDYQKDFIKSVSIPLRIMLMKIISEFTLVPRNGKSLPYYIDSIIGDGNVNLLGVLLVRF
jgi:hypothetical protein